MTIFVLALRSGSPEGGSSMVVIERVSPGIAHHKPLEVDGVSWAQGVPLQHSSSQPWHIVSTIRLLRITHKHSLFMFDIYLPSNPEVIACKLLINFKEIKQKLQPEELDI